MRETRGGRLLLAVGLLAATVIAPQATHGNSLLSCLGGLKAMQQYVAQHRPDLDPEYLRAQMGWVLLSQSTSSSASDFQSIATTELSDIVSCIGIGLDVQHVDFLIRAVHGYIGEEIMQHVEQCQAGILVVSTSYAARYGRPAGQELERVLSKGMGATLTRAKRFHRGSEPDAKSTYAKGVQLAARLLAASEDDRSALLTPMSVSCSWFGIRLSDYLGILSLLPKAQ